MIMESLGSKKERENDSGISLHRLSRSNFHLATELSCASKLLQIQQSHDRIEKSGFCCIFSRGVRGHMQKRPVLPLWLCCVFKWAMCDKTAICERLKGCKEKEKSMYGCLERECDIQ